MVAGATRVIIVGGGFAGVACAHRLAGRDGIEVTLLDQRGTQEFKPLLYQVATGELAPADVSFDLTHRLHRHHNLKIRTAEVTSADPRTRQVRLAGGETLQADALVLAAGSQPNFFGTTGAEQHAYPLYSLAGAEAIRGQVMRLLRQPAPDGPTRFVVVGGGPTGVETAGALADLIDDVAPHLPAATAAPEVVLIDHGQVLLAPFSTHSQDRARQRLAERGVQLRFGLAVRQVAPDHVVLSDGSSLPTELTIWAGGQRAGPLIGHTGLPTGHGGRVAVTPDLTVTGFPGVYAVGDAANIPAGDHGTLPQLGSVATQTGDWAGRAILAVHKGLQAEPFRYGDKGIMAMIDRQSAVAEIGHRHHEVHGRLAFAAWLAVHDELLHNARAELDALIRWADEFYLRPHHRAEALLDPSTADLARLRPAVEAAT